ncbi:MAG: alpha/beta hydrolase [Rhizobiaceae bacterium]|nr:alpha/beta hydrolase [Rhizobiaceae bacterium]
MLLHRVTDWDDAYANGINVPRGERWPDAWVEPAAGYRKRMGEAGRARLGLAYGPGDRHRFDLFLPEGQPEGLVVFVHGGYWMRFDNSFWSHLAAGAVDSGHAVAMPSYTLCPQVRIRDIVAEIGQAVGAAAREVSGPVRLTGHSAGGHLASRMIAKDSPVPADVLKRVVNTVSISGLHDLRSIIRTGMNATLGLDAGEAAAESPALLEPIEGARLVCWVGGAERSEFIRQNALLANVWAGLGAATAAVVEPDRHHFTIIDGLADQNHPLTKALLDG